MARQVGFQDDVNPKTTLLGAIIKYSVLDLFVVIAFVAAILYLQTDVLFGLGVPQHQFSVDQTTMYTVITVVITCILSALLFFVTLWPALKGVRNAK